MNIYLLIALPTVLNQNCELDKTTYFSTRWEVRQRPTLWLRLSTQGLQKESLLFGKVGYLGLLPI